MRVCCVQVVHVRAALKNSLKSAFLILATRAPFWWKWPSLFSKISFEFGNPSSVICLSLLQRITVGTRKSEESAPKLETLKSSEPSKNDRESLENGLEMKIQQQKKNKICPSSINVKIKDSPEDLEPQNNVKMKMMYAQIVVMNDDDDSSESNTKLNNCRE